MKRRKKRTFMCVDNTAVLNAAKSQCSGESTSIVPHRYLLTNTPLKFAGGPAKYENPLLELEGEMGVAKVESATDVA